MTSLNIASSADYGVQSEDSMYSTSVYIEQKEKGLSQKEFVHIIISMLIVNVVVGLLITTTYLVTQPVMAQNKLKQENALKTAAGQLELIKKVLPDVKSIVKSGTWSNNGIEADYYIVNNSDGSMGYGVISFAKGYSSTLKVLTGIDAKGKITKVAVLEQGETPGLGDQVLGEEFQTRFTGADLSKLQVTTTGDNNAIQAITAATISSKAVIEDAVKNAYIYYMNELIKK